MNTFDHIHKTATVAHGNTIGVVRVINPLVLLNDTLVLLVLGLVIINLLLG